MAGLARKDTEELVETGGVAQHVEIVGNHRGRGVTVTLALTGLDSLVFTERQAEGRVRVLDRLVAAHQALQHLLHGRLGQHRHLPGRRLALGRQQDHQGSLEEHDHQY